MEHAVFVDLMRRELKEFREHVDRVTKQYHAVKDLKLKMPSHHAICQMDFAENYRCDQADEVQAAYFDKGLVTVSYCFHNGAFKPSCPGWREVQIKPIR